MLMKEIKILQKRKKYIDMNAVKICWKIKNKS